MKKHLFAFVGFFAVLGIFNLFIYSGKKDPINPVRGGGVVPEKYHVFAVDIPKELSFAGEKVPLNDFDVRERIDREMQVNVYWQSQTLLMIKRANRWFPIMEPILKKNNIPDDVKFIALTESGLTNVISPSGATGFWQFMDPTARSYGMVITGDVDERYNVEKSTEAACKYFQEAYNTFGNWTLAAASYNMGIGGVQAQLQNQRVKSYYDLLLNEETFRYIARLLAIKEVISSPSKYGFEYRKTDLYPQLPTYTVSVDSSINDLVSFAEHFKMTYKTLKVLNPWLRQTYLSNGYGKRYEIAILREGFVYPEDEDVNIPTPPVITTPKDTTTKTPKK